MKDIFKIGGAIVLCIIAFTIYQELYPNYITKTETKLVQDSTKVDSLQTQLTRWQTIADSLREVKTDTVEITKFKVIDDSTKQYTSHYSDSTISATWKTRVVGTLENQIFEYILKRQKVIEKNTTLTLTRTKTYEKTITRTRQPDPYFFIGGEAGTESLGPIVGYNTSKQYSIFYRYDINTESHNVGVLIPIRFNLNPFK